MPYVKYAAQQYSSVRANIINDDETTATLLEMVEIAHKIILKDTKIHQLRNLLAEVITNTPNLNEKLRTVRRKELFSGVQCGVGGGLDDAELQNTQYEKYESTRGFTTHAESYTVNQIIDSFIVEILKFLAMKVLLEVIPGSQGDPMDSTRALHDDSDPSRHQRTLPPRSPVDLVPSDVIRDGWKALLNLPFLYKDVCMAMGCDVPVDLDLDTVPLKYSGEEDRFEHESVKKARSNYRYTMDTYERVYLEVPNQEFWLRLTYLDGEDEKETNLCDDFSDVMDWLCVTFKERLNGREDRMPNSVEFEIV
jgi:hypothetical protein